jgi:hypothetical protein
MNMVDDLFISHRCESERQYIPDEQDVRCSAKSASLQVQKSYLRDRSSGLT